MENTERYIRAIQVTYQIGKDKQIVGQWIYARLPYNEYKSDDLDELDNEIFKNVTRLAKKEPPPDWIKEVDQGWEVYNKPAVWGKTRFEKNISIFPSLAQTEDIVSEIIGENTHEVGAFKIHFLCNRTQTDPDLIAIPSAVSASVPMDKFEAVKQSYQPYFNA